MNSDSRRAREGWPFDALLLQPRIAVGTFIPDGFDSYLRIFHPATLSRRSPVQDGARADIVVSENITWREIAHANNREVADELRSLRGDCRPAQIATSTDELGGPVDRLLWNGAPSRGRMPGELASQLIAILRRYTSTPARVECGVWEGYESDSALPDESELVELPMLRCYRRYRLSLQGVNDAFTLTSHRSAHPPNLWWPADRQWCVATEIDYRWTYVGASQECARAISQNRSIESLATSLDEGNFMES